MNNAWTTIVRRAPCSRSPAGPLLELFTGYARCNRRNASVIATPKTVYSWNSRARPLSTCAILQAHAQRSRPPLPGESRPPSRKQSLHAEESSAQIQPAQTVASHTEGLTVPDPESEADSITWRDYDPLGGMPLPSGELPAETISQIFSSDTVDADTGNYILNVLYWRRQSGALIDSGIDFPKSSGVTREQALKALEYVRSLDPAFDEQAAGQRWVEEESGRLEEQLTNRAVELGLYKAEEPEEEQQGTEEGRARTSESELVKHRKEEEAKWEQEQAELAAKKAREETAALHSQRGPLELAGNVQPSVAVTSTGDGSITIGGAPRFAELKPYEERPWVKYYAEQAQVIRSNILPQLSTFRRLSPSLLVLLATLGLSSFLSDAYTPPPVSARIFPDIPPPVATLGALTAVLATTFILGRLPPFWATLNRHFTIIPAYPRASSMLGYMFRHDTFGHLFVNSAILWSFGLTLHSDVGRGTFLAVLFSTGAAGGFVTLTASVLRKQWTAYTFGLSGAALGIASATCTLRPEGTLRVPFTEMELPFAAWGLAVLLAGIDIGAILLKKQTGVDHWGHLGGMAMGVVAGMKVRNDAAARRDDPAQDSSALPVEAIQEE